jgi:hypothetical protein
MESLIPGTPPNATITAVGNINKTPGLGLTQGGSDYDSKYATYLKLFSGEMFKAYESACIAKGTVQNRTLTSGRSMQFIFHWPHGCCISSAWYSYPRLL